MEQQYGTLRIALVGIGLDAYWPQFIGLRERLLRYVASVEEKIGGHRREIVNLGLVDTTAKGIAAGHACRAHDVDLLAIYVTTYALSSTVLPLIQHARVPVLLLNLQPEAAIAYRRFNAMDDRTAMTGEWLAFCASCPVPEIANVLRRLGIAFHQVTGMLENDPVCWDGLEEWLRAAAVVKTLAHSRLGLMGHYYSGMLDIATDLAQVTGRFGTTLDHIEVDELSALREGVSSGDLSRKLAEFQEFFEVMGECSRAELERAAKTSIALDRLVEGHGVDMLAYFYSGTGVAANEDTMSSIIVAASLLTGRGIPVAGEYEVKNALAMKMMDLLGVGGSFTEYYAIDFADDVVLMGHDGPGHVRIAQDRIKVRPLTVYHGKVGQGLSVEMSVKHGPVTLLSVVEDRECGFRLLVAEAESVAGPILEIGNTNSRYRFSIGARRFVEAWNAEGPAHHCAIGLGHVSEVLKKVACLLGFPFRQIC